VLQLLLILALSVWAALFLLGVAIAAVSGLVARSARRAVASVTSGQRSVEALRALLSP
jgi:hypothetical protein